MKELETFIIEIYNLSDDVTFERYATDTFVFFEKNYQYFLIASPSRQELAGLQAVVTYLHNNSLIHQKNVPTMSGSDIVEFQGKFYTLFETKPAQELTGYSLIKTRLDSMLTQLRNMLTTTQDFAELFQSKESYIVTAVASKILRQIDKAIAFFEEHELVKVSPYDAITVNADMSQLLKQNVIDLIEKLNTDISREAININVENSFFVIDKQTELRIVDKIFLGHPVFLYARLAALVYQMESAVDDEDLLSMIKASYETDTLNHFTMEYFDTLVTVYQLIQLYHMARKTLDTDDFCECKELVRALYQSKVVEWN